MCRLLLLAVLSLLTSVALPAAVPPAEPTPTPPIATWTPGPPQPKANATVLSPSATTTPSPIPTPELAPAQSPVSTLEAETPAIHRDALMRSWLKAMAILTLVALAVAVLWRLKPFRRRQ